MYDNNTTQGGAPLTMMQLAGRGGLVMGLYYIVRFAICVLALGMPLLALLYAGLVIAAPFVCGLLAAFVRNRHLGGVMTFGQGFKFSFISMLFGGILEAAAQYVYFRYLDQGRFVDGLYGYLSQLGSSGLGGDMLSSRRDVIDNFAAQPPINIAMATFSNGIIWIFIIALFIGLILRRETPGRLV